MENFPESEDSLLDAEFYMRRNYRSKSQIWAKGANVDAIAHAKYLSFCPFFVKPPLPGGLCQVLWLKLGRCLSITESQLSF